MEVQRKKIGLYADDSNLISTYTAKAPKGELYSTIGSSVYNNLGGEYDLLVFVDGAQVTAPAIGNYFDKNSTPPAGVSGNGVLTELYVDSIKKEVRIVMVNTYLVKGHCRLQRHQGRADHRDR